MRNRPHSSRGLGHRPLKAEITGSNPVCGTNAKPYAPGPRPGGVLLCPSAHDRATDRADVDKVVDNFVDESLAAEGPSEVSSVESAGADSGKTSEGMTQEARTSLRAVGRRRATVLGDRVKFATICI